MKEHIFILLLLLLTSLPFAAAEPPNGTIPFDCPDVPNPKFQFHFTQELIGLAVSTFPFSTVESVYIHIYDDGGNTFDKLLQYYVGNLKAENWHNLHVDNTMHLYMLQKPTSGESQQAKNTVLGIFAVIKDDGNVHLLNIVGSIPPKQVRKLLTNLGELGIDIPALKSIGDLAFPKSEVVSVGLPLPTLFRMSENPAVAKTDSALFSASYEENHHGHWTYRRHPIEQIRIRTSDQKHIAVVSEGLKSGSGDITALLEGLSLNSGSADTPRFIVLPEEKTITITAGKMLDETRPTMLTKSFHTQDGDRIHEIVIQGSHYTDTNTVRGALEKGPAEIGAAVGALTDEVSTFEKVNLSIVEQDSQRTAIITAVERPPDSRFYMEGSPHIGFNRVTGWELGARLESGFRVQRERGSVYRFRFTPESDEGDNSKLFGQMGYGFSDKQPYYRVGGRAVWEEPYSWGLGLTAQYQRGTSSIARDLFSHYNDTATLFLRMFGVPDHQDYYLRQGIEVDLEWKVVFPKRPSHFLLPDHSFKLIFLAEAHESIEKKHRLAPFQLVVEIRDAGKSTDNPRGRCGVSPSDTILIPVTIISARTILFSWSIAIRHSVPISIGRVFKRICGMPIRSETIKSEPERSSVLPRHHSRFSGNS